MKKKVSVSWSGGKDSAFSLYKILLSGEYEVISLHTVFDFENRRVGMHGIREKLVEEQAHAVGLPLEKLFLPASETHSAYKDLILKFYKECRADGVEAIVFGDIFLADLKAFRDSILAEAGLTGIYPLWQIESKILIDDFINLGFKTMVCAANGKYLDQSVLGKTLDEAFIKSLPIDVDPCGENGEFHTFVYEGPVFGRAIEITRGPVTERKYEFKVSDESGGSQARELPFLFIDLF